MIRKILHAITRPFWWVILGVDWLLSAVSTTGRPQSMDDANAQYGLDSRDALGERIGRAGPKPGERLPPR